MGWPASSIVMTSGSDTGKGCTDALGLDLGFGFFKPKPGLIMLSLSATLPTEMSSKNVCMILIMI